MNEALKVPEFVEFMDSSPSANELYCARRLKVIAEEHRLAILKLLFAGPKHVWEINVSLSIEQSLLSHHLKVLRQQGFVESCRDGKAVLYQLVPDVRPALGEGIDLGCCTVSFAPESAAVSDGRG
ncbi:metalloregulator ArsR/SmtB family transcription factor [Synechococcus sp. PCC 7336]|uniref:ArsR/SmtB family transcription factor n=1 Tax=Synechococcus sp. PCC 7336 TaxID=195250 RepID=UPI00034B626F|nr:metalloregulator ArsR/SmtB family transcription factor [Synechococcus sp. PCC 7336]